MYARFDAFGAFMGTGMNAMRPGSAPWTQGGMPQQQSQQQSTAPAKSEDAKTRMANRQGTGSSLFAGALIDDINRKKTLLGGS